MEEGDTSPATPPGGLNHGKTWMCGKWNYQVQIIFRADGRSTCGIIYISGGCSEDVEVVLDLMVIHSCIGHCLELGMLLQAAQKHLLTEGKFDFFFKLIVKFPQYKEFIQVS